VPFPEKFKHLLEMRQGDVESPRHVCLVYAVCGHETHSCGWHGWILAAAWRDPGQGDPDGDPYDYLLPGAYESDVRCPRCGRALASTGVKAWLAPERCPWPGHESDGAPMQYEYAEDPDRLLAEEYRPLGLKRVRWKDRHPEADRDHEHCEICFARFSDGPYDQHEGMSDGLYRWVCFACWRRIEEA